MQRTVFLLLLELEEAAMSSQLRGSILTSRMECRMKRTFKYSFIHNNARLSDYDTVRPYVTVKKHVNS